MDRERERLLASRNVVHIIYRLDWKEAYVKKKLLYFNKEKLWRLCGPRHLEI
jgi:hypothetical protein